LLVDLFKTHQGNAKFWNWQYGLRFIDFYKRVLAKACQGTYTDWVAVKRGGQATNAHFNVITGCQEVPVPNRRRKEFFMNGQKRNTIHPGIVVEVVQKQDQQTGKRTRGVVKDILTSSPTHPHGIKVRLTDGTVGRVQEIMP
jgi:uncharacterized repeat protein (TIGR03833 family)